MDAGQAALNLLEYGRQWGLPAMIKRYYGFYQALVTDNKDPAGLGRVQAKAPRLGQTTAPDVWIAPAFALAGAGRGFFFVPEKDDVVWVTYDEGDPDKPQMYIGGWFGKKSELPLGKGYSADGYPDKQGFATRAGHAVTFDDTAGQESVTILWNQPSASDPASSDRTKSGDPTIATNKKAFLSFDKDGGITLHTSPSNGIPGSTIQIDEKNHQMILSHTLKDGSAGNSIIMDASGTMQLHHHKSSSYIQMGNNGLDVTVGGSSINLTVNGTVNLNASSINLGASAKDHPVLTNILAPFLQLLQIWLATHTHTSAAPGSPTTPPVGAPVPNPPAAGVLGSQSVGLQE